MPGIIYKVITLGIVLQKSLSFNNAKANKHRAQNVLCILIWPLLLTGRCILVSNSDKTASCLMYLVLSVLFCSYSVETVTKNIVSIPVFGKRDSDCVCLCLRERIGQRIRLKEGGKRDAAQCAMPLYERI